MIARRLATAAWLGLLVVLGMYGAFVYGAYVQLACNERDLPGGE